MKEAVDVKETTHPPGFMGEPTLAHPPAVIERDPEAESLAESVERSFIARLTAMENGEKFLRQREQLLNSLYAMAVKRTRPEDWIISKDPQGVATAMIRSSGAQLVNEVYGIRIFDIRPVDKDGRFAPEKIPNTNGSYTLRAWFSASSTMSGRSVELLEVNRRSDEEFTGRSTDIQGNIVKRDGVAAVEGDLRSALLTLIPTKAARVLGNMARVPVSDLQRIWAADKSIDNAAKGHGYGSSSERKVDSLTDDQVKAKQAGLGNDIMSRVGGDQTAAASLLMELTANPDKGFKGFDSAKKLTKDWQFSQAWKKLREHPTFGDTAMGDGPEAGGDA